MTRLVWNAIGERFFEAGVERGVLYVDGVGVAWNGLISVSETPSGGDIKSYYVDGVKYMDYVSMEEYAATIEAYTYPDEFLACEGVTEINYGLFATQQSRKPFSLCYKSSIGNDVDGVAHAFKLHLIYNATATPSDRGYASLNDSVEPYNFSWKISAKPPVVAGLKPTPNFVIDSRDVPQELMDDLLDILYGTASSAPRLPSLSELVSIFDSYQTSRFDAGHLTEEYFTTFDAGRVGDAYTSTIDGGHL